MADGLQYAAGGDAVIALAYTPLASGKLVCQDCGTTVHPEFRGNHDDWHNRVSTLARQGDFLVRYLQAEASHESLSDTPTDTEKQEPSDCTGKDDCPALIHIHGCFAERDTPADV